MLSEIAGLIGYAFNELSHFTLRPQLNVPLNFTEVV